VQHIRKTTNSKQQADEQTICQGDTNRNANPCIPSIHSANQSFHSANILHNSTTDFAKSSNNTMTVSRSTTTSMHINASFHQEAEADTEMQLMPA
jgi:hypothetical protein